MVSCVILGPCVISLFKKEPAGGAKCVKDSTVLHVLKQSGEPVQLMS